MCAEVCHVGHPSTQSTLYLVLAHRKPKLQVILQALCISHRSPSGIVSYSEHVCFCDACWATFEIKGSIVSPFQGQFHYLLFCVLFSLGFCFCFLVQGLEPKSLNMLGKSLSLSYLFKEKKNLTRASIK